MKMNEFKKITIVSERLLREQLVGLLKQEGASGYTILAAEGEGSRGVNVIDFEGRHLQIETIVPPEIAERILRRIGRELLDDFAVIVYQSDVSVLRHWKFGSSRDAGPGDGKD
jgi:hypothetical protein